MLGILYAALGAFTFALNNVAMRRGVVTGSVLQGMALTVPIGGLSDRSSGGKSLARRAHVNCARCPASVAIEGSSVPGALLQAE